MRILYVHESAGHFGGAEANVFDTATELKQRGYQLAMAASRRTGKGDSDWDQLFGDLLQFPTSKNEWNKLFETFRPDLIYLHKWDDLESLQFLLSFGRPMIRMVHDHDLYCLRSYKYHPVTRQICSRPASGYCVFPCLAPIQRNRGGWFPIRWLSFSKKLKELKLNRNIDCMLVASDYMRNELEINRFDPSSIRILPPVPRASVSTPSTFAPINRIVYAGQIVRGKGVDVLVRALAQVKEPFECWICGDGSHRAECEALARDLGLEKKVNFTGFIPRAEIQNISHDASVALVSSVWPEPFGLVGLEAMRSSLPVVAFDAGGIRDWLKDSENGFLVPWMDVTTYATRIDQLLKNKELARSMGQRGTQMLAEKYDFDKYITNLETLFLELQTKKKIS